MDTQSNVQFGEGGAGTFSDGKLNTGINSEKINIALGELIKYGAPEQIAYDSKPHIGTDKLTQVVANMRRDIIALGGEVYFNSRLTDLIIKDGRLTGVYIENADRGLWSVDCDYCILAIGHSARDTFEMLSSKVLMQAKPFSVGVRIEHLQRIPTERNTATLADFRRRLIRSPLISTTEDRAILFVCVRAVTLCPRLRKKMPS